MRNVLKKIVFALLTIFSCNAISVMPVIADNAVYSTVGGTWVKENDTTWTMDKDGDGKTDVTLIKENDEWKYIFSVADDSSMYYGWEVNPPAGYEIENGYGSKQNPAISIQYAHTENIDKDGAQSGTYAGGVDTNKVYSIPGASSISVVITSDFADGDYVVIWDGNHPDYTAANSESGTKITGQVNKGEYTFNNSTITIGFHSEAGGEKKYGYYAIISGDKNKDGLSAVNVSKEEPVLETGSLMVSKQVLEADGSESTDDKVFKFNVELTSDNDEIASMLDNKKTYGDVTIENGTGSFYLSNGKSVTMTGIPAGVRYNISEVEDSDYETTLTGGNGVISSDNEAVINCINKKKPKIETEKYSITIKKEVKENGNKKEDFNFHIAFENLEKNTEYSYEKSGVKYTFTSDENKAADIAFTLADKDSIVFDGIPEAARYKITEDANSYYASYEITDTVKVAQQKQVNSQTDQSLSTGLETVDNGENAVVTFTNTGKEPDVPEVEKIKIKIKKVWNDNENAENTRPDSITVYLMQDDNVIKNITLNESNGWEVEIDGLEKGEHVYSVAEEDVSGYVANVTEADNEGMKEYTVTNTAIETGSIKVSKTVAGENADKNKLFKFNIELKKDNVPVSGVFKLDNVSGTEAGTIAFDENGKASFELSHGESIVITGLPAGTEYLVTENIYKEYEPSDNGSYSGKINGNEEVQINVINTHKEVHSLTVKKTVRGNQGDKSKSFNFTLHLSGTEGIEVPSDINCQFDGKAQQMKADADGNVNFKLKHGEEIVFKDLPAGISYEIIENGAEEDGYTVTGKNEAGTLDSDMTAEIVNTKNVGIPTSAMTNTVSMIFIIAIGGFGFLYLIKRKKM